MRTKTYICTKFLDLTTEVEVKGQMKQIRLKGGIMSPRRINGTYTTNDPDIQEAIEAAPGFNKRFKLLKDWGETKQAAEGTKKVIEPITGPHNATEEIFITGPTPETSPDAVKVPDPVPGTEEKDPELIPRPSDHPIIDEAATSGQKAKSFLKDHFDDITSSMVRNNTMIRELAEKRNVEFPNWPKE